MKVLIGCEQFGIVRDAFLARGHDAWSCDLEAGDRPSNRHIIGDVRDVMMENWDLLIILHPPCTRLCNSGVRWLSEPPKNPPADCTPEEAAAWPHLNREDRLAMIWRHLDQGAELFSTVWNVPHIPMVALENPVMHSHAKQRIRGYVPPAQSVQPWQYGTDVDGPDNERKRTCLWLRGLQNLTPTGTLDGSTARDSVHKAPPGKDRWKLRSRFFPGIAHAMADQWGGEALAQMAA